MQHSNEDTSDQGFHPSHFRNDGSSGRDPPRPRGPRKYRGDHDNRSPRSPRPVYSSFSDRRRTHDRPHTERISRRPTHRFDRVPEGTPSLNEQRPKKSLWDKRPKLLDDISARDAREIGLFAEPGATLNPSITSERVKEMLSKNLVRHGSLKLEASRLGPSYSRTSKRLVVSGINIEEHSAEKIQKVLEGFLASTVIPGVEPGDYKITTRIVTTDEKILIVETTKPVVTTVLLTLSDTSLPNLDTTFHLERPHEYVAFNWKPEQTKEGDEEEAKEVIIENTHLLCLRHIPYGVDREAILGLLTKYGKLDTLAVLLDKITYESKGSAFFSFKKSKGDDKDNTDDLLSKLNEEELDGAKLECFRPCFNSNTKYSQSANFDSRKLLDYVDQSTASITVHNDSKVLRFLNCVAVADLFDDSKCKEIETSFVEECKRFGNVTEFLLPRPNEAFRKGLDEMKPEFGEIFVQFSTAAEAKDCLYYLAGRTFYGRLVIGGYFDEDDFQRGML
ncbi:DEKNAAC102301 [Brettanomyces naardenensis]|uniref:DEKNAAC102301 n=1 Tax=Brettanomyces naardenensis TaxID=13370 RepID=A0A448YL88_BRENA|nr:DEKNAAC102301 [Brettanomyces naardenensis]